MDITELLTAWGDGNEDALAGLMPMVYPELRRVARKHLAGRLPGQTLESAALVNEAYLKLRGWTASSPSRLPRSSFPSHLLTGRVSQKVWLPGQDSNLQPFV